MSETDYEDLPEFISVDIDTPAPPPFSYAKSNDFDRFSSLSDGELATPNIFSFHPDDALNLSDLARQRFPRLNTVIPIAKLTPDIFAALHDITNDPLLTVYYFVDDIVTIRSPSAENLRSLPIAEPTYTPRR